MHMDVFAWWSLLIIALAVFAEIRRDPGFGVIASTVVIILGLLILTGGLQVQIGTDTVKASTANTTDNVTVSTLTETERGVWTDVDMAYADFSDLFGILFVLAGVAAFYSYIAGLPQFRRLRGM